MVISFAREIVPGTMERKSFSDIRKVMPWKVASLLTYSRGIDADTSDNIHDIF